MRTHSPFLQIGELCRGLCAYVLFGTLKQEDASTWAAAKGAQGAGGDGCRLAWLKMVAAGGVSCL